MIAALLLSTLFFAAPHASIAAGLGLAQGGLGASFEVRSGHFAALLGTSVLTTPGPNVGVRAFLDDGEGLMLTLNGALTDEHRDGRTGLTAYASATLGWRFRWASGVFVDAAAGPMAHWLEHSGARYETQGWHFGPVQREYLNAAPYLPDVELAVGFQF